MSDFKHIANLFKELTENPDKVDKLTKEQIEELRRYNNPYGKSNRNEDVNGYCCVSVTNLQEKFMEKMFMVAYASFFFRVADEYEIKDSFRYVDKDYVSHRKILTKLTPIIKKDADAHIYNRSDDLLKHYNSNKLASFKHQGKLYADSEFIKEKLIKENLKLNEYENLVSSIVDSYDKKRKLIENSSDDTLVKKEKIDKLRRLEEEEYKKTNVKNNITQKIQLISKLLDEFKAQLTKMENYKENFIKDEIKRFLKFYLEYNPEVHLKLDRDPIGNDRYRKSLQIEPKTKLPINIFKTFQLYKDANYDEIVKEVEALWAYKPELENTITILEDGLKTKEEADNYIENNKDIFTIQVHSIQKGRPYFLSAYKANVDKVIYYNENTEVLEAIEKRMKEEQKVGEELLRHRVQRLRKERKEDFGEENEEAVSYLRKNKSSSSEIKQEDILEESEVVHLPVFTRDAKGFDKKEIFIEASAKVASTDPNQNNKSLDDIKFNNSNINNASSSSLSLEERKNKRLMMSEMPL